MRITKAALMLPCVALLAGCGGKGGGTTIVVTTGGSGEAPAARLGPYRIPSLSMEPTYSIGEHVEVETGQPRVDEVLVFHPPDGAIQQVCGPQPHLIKTGAAACAEPVPSESRIEFIKRVVAGPGDTISIVEGHVIRNGKRELDSYIRPCPPSTGGCNFPVPITIPANEWYLLGDNRGESDDSRFWGPVPTSWIVGVVPR